TAPSPTRSPVGATQTGCELIVSVHFGEQPTVHENVRSSNVGTLVGRKKDSGLSYILRRGHPTERVEAAQSLQLRLRIWRSRDVVLKDFSANVSRTNGVTTYLICTIGHRGSATHRTQPTFGRSVGSQIPITYNA